MKKINKILVANRSEIAIRIFRAAAELDIKTVAVYTYEDRFCLHRFKADESYQIGGQGEPIKNYLDIEQLIHLAKKNKIDAIHPGYGFLSENYQFAKRCREEGITFIGPSNHVLEQLGDKIKARQTAISANIAVLGGNDHALASLQEAKETIQKLGYPVILKAAHGGGGRGMRIIRAEDELASALEAAKSESLSAFGSDEVFIEKFIENAKHIEVQLLGDEHGNLVHLYERDCSLQRRHQKVIEIAPSPTLSQSLREEICQAGLKIGKSVNYSNAGTVEFLLDTDTNQFYFIEVNPRIQVEHTVSEEITGVDIVKAQILVAMGFALSSEEIGISSQASIHTNGFALQSRITTEDASNNFTPDYGRITHYRSASGAGIRLDAGSAFSGSIVNPYYDSMLVKVTAKGRIFKEACARLSRALREFRIRGVKTNILFLEHLILTDVFQSGQATTHYIDQTPSLFDFKTYQNRSNKLLGYLAETIVNGNKTVANRPTSSRRSDILLREFHSIGQSVEGSRQKFKRLGIEKFIAAILKEKSLLVTDTSLRDAHQSLLATRFRTNDMLNIAEYYHYLTPELFSLEMWGGATFDTSMRFLNESPWDRLESLREKIPNTLFQMLLRGSSAVGYSNYPDNVVRQFVKQAAQSGIDIFRVFDALNWTDNLQVAMDAVNEAGAICEGTICYTGDILDPSRHKYDLKYYVNLAKKIEKMGAHILAIKDMAGLCKPDAIDLLVRTLKQEIAIPVHFHTHDTSGMAAASVISAANAGVDIADMAVSSMSGGTSQPNMNTILESIRFSKRKSDLNTKSLDEISEYFRMVREMYTAFETETLPSTSDLYQHEMPGGQYTNLFAQAKALGLSNQWSEICQTYADVNQLFGDIIKVTPSSKAVGDMALFMVANQYSTDDILDTNNEISYPESILDLISGKMGQPYQGFPKKTKDAILKRTPELTERAGKILPPADFDSIQKELINKNYPNDLKNVLSAILYPKVYEDFIQHQQKYSDTSRIPTYAFFHGMKIGEEININLQQGKTIIVKYLAVSEACTEGKRTVFFELNGQPREITVFDESLKNQITQTSKADKENPKHLGASTPGMVVNLSVKDGDQVKKGQKLLSIEAMKMETTIYAERNSQIDRVFVQKGSNIETDDLLIQFL